ELFASHEEVVDAVAFSGPPRTGRVRDREAHIGHALEQRPHERRLARARRRGEHDHPSAWTAFRAPSLLQILYLLAHLLDQDLELDRRAREILVLRFRAERIRLAVHLLQEKIETTPDRLGALEHRPHLGDVRREPVHLLTDVEALRD